MMAGSGHPKMMGLGNGDSFQRWLFLVSMLNFWDVSPIGEC